jgi:hypothetical protein
MFFKKTSLLVDKVLERWDAERRDEVLSGGKRCVEMQGNLGKRGNYL